ncbi:MAG: PIN domain-containing protein [Cyanobacteria bacterium P01_D01_bin.156]
MVDKVLFDTSALVAALLKDHPFHKAYLPWLEQALNQEIIGYISTHTLAELYAVLTRLPRQPKLQPKEVQTLLSNFEHFQKVILNADDYSQVMQRLVQQNIIGGGIYDALIAQAALKAEVKTLLTANPKDFVRLGSDIASIVQTLSTL